MKTKLLIVALALTTSLSAVEWEYKVEDKEDTTTILSNVGDILNNSSISQKQLPLEGNNCNEGYVLVDADGNVLSESNKDLGVYCVAENDLEMNVTDIGGLTLLDNVATNVKLDFYNNYNSEGEKLANPVLIPNISKEYDLADSTLSNIVIPSFFTGDVSCLTGSEDYSFSKDDEEFSSYFVIKVPTTESIVGEKEELTKVLEENLQCEFVGAMNSREVKERIASELKSERDAADYKSIIYSHIPYQVTDMSQNSPKTKMVYSNTSSSETQRAIPTIVRYSNLNIQAKKDFYYLNGDVSMNELITEVSNGSTVFNKKSSGFAGIPSNLTEYEETKSDLMIFEDMNSCSVNLEAATPDSSALKDLLKRKSKNITYNMNIKYGDILTQYNFKSPLDIFNEDDIKKYIRDEYAGQIDPTLYEDFFSDKTFDLKITRTGTEEEMANFYDAPTLQDKAEIFPKILPVINEKNVDTSCQDLEVTTVQDVYVEAKILTCKDDQSCKLNDPTTYDKIKTVGLTTVDSVKTLGYNLTDSEVITYLLGGLQEKVNKEVRTQEGFLSYGYETQSASLTEEMSLGNPVNIDLMKNRDDIFEQYIMDSDKLKDQISLTRKLIFTPAKLKIKKFKCKL